MMILDVRIPKWHPQDVDDAMLLDPPDPVDLLIAHTHADQAVNLGARQDELRNVFQIPKVCKLEWLLSTV